MEGEQPNQHHLDEMSSADLSMLLTNFIDYLSAELEHESTDIHDGSIAGTAEYPEFVLESKRLESFSHWPISLKQKPEQLSDAGFFYTGRGDRVICFSCGGGLGQWGENDDVWEEHGLHYGECKYMQLCKGLNFHAEMIEREASAQLEAMHIHIPEKDETKLECDRDNLKSNECQICCVNKYNTTFIPCGHVCACTKCASSLLQCPLCRKRIENVLRIFLPE